MLKSKSTPASEVAVDSQSLLDRARSGDADAFCELCRDYEARLLRQAWAVCGDPTGAEELAQDTLVEAWKCLRRYNGRCKFFTWLCAILLNRHRSSYRRRRFRLLELFAGHGEEVLPDAPEPAIGDHAWPDRLAQEHEQSALVRRCVQALPEKHRQVVYLRFFAGESLEGIAEALSCSVGTVKSRLFNGLEKLRTMRDLNHREDDSHARQGLL